jgi:YesN/AraC family two-component response regulator
MPIKDVAEAVCLGDPTYFCKLFKKKTGMSAKEYRNSVTD